MRRVIFSLLAGMALQTYAQLATLDLSGTWRFQTDPMGVGMTPGSELYLSRLAETISLPGTMDEGGKGLPNAARYVDRLGQGRDFRHRLPGHCPRNRPAVHVSQFQGNVEIYGSAAAAQL